MDKMSKYIKFSEPFINIQVEEGVVYRSTLVFESSDKSFAMKGRIHSTNDMLLPEQTNFEGSRVEIPFFFKGKLSKKGSVFYGDFVLVTNLGEYNVPFNIEVVERMMETSNGRINTLEAFTKLYEEKPEEAVSLFFQPAFLPVFLSHDIELQILYRNFQKARKKAVIVEEFLVTAGYKETTRLSVNQGKLVLDAGRDTDTITLKMEKSGYLEGIIYAQKDQVELSVSSFTSKDFEDGILKIKVRQDPDLIMGTDVISVVTARQTLNIPVEWWGTIPVSAGLSKTKQKVKKLRADLMYNYLSFRTGGVGFDDFVQDTLHALEDLDFMDRSPEWKLYRMHINIMQEKKEAVNALAEEIEKENLKEKGEILLYNYFLYLKALDQKSASAISKAVLSIRDLYEYSEYKPEAFWMLLYLDREYVYNKRLQYDTIKLLFESGYNSSLLYFEACDILNDNPNFMEELGSFELRIFRWGLRYGCVSMALAQKFARLALKVKYFKKSIFYMAIRLYAVEPDERFLLLICSLLIKGNMTDKKYHSYFKAGIEANLKLIGLNEFFIRSMDYDQYEIIPQRVLIYFTYSNSLDSVEKAYLYVNILKNKKEYEEVYGAYAGKIFPFVEEQLLRGRIDEHFAYLYSYYMPELLVKPEYSKAICDVMFYQKLVCTNPNIVGVYVNYPEIGKERYYPLSGQSSKIEIFNERTQLFFVNQQEQRFCKDIDYELIPLMDLSKVSKQWINANQSNGKLLLMQSMKLEETIEEEYLDMAKMIYSDSAYVPWIKEMAIEAILLYYGNHISDMENLARWLERTDYSAISYQFREKLITYYLRAGMIENAFFGVELYGNQCVNSKDKKKIAEFAVDHYKGYCDDTTLALAYNCMIHKCYSKKILAYLLEFLEGEVLDYLILWDRCRECGMDTESLEEKILYQCIYTGTHHKAVYRVFENYYMDNKNSDLIHPYLEFIDRRIQSEDALPVGIMKIMGKEISCGKIDSDRARIQYLYYFARHKKEQEEEKAHIRQFIDELLQKEIYLPVYHVYEYMTVLPVEQKERTFFTYKGKAGCDVHLYYKLQGNEATVADCKLEEILPGRYVNSMYFYQNDRVDFYLECDGEKVEDQESYRFEGYRFETESSRFFALNELGKKDIAIEDLRTYLKNVYYVQQCMSLL